MDPKAFMTMGILKARDMGRHGEIWGRYGEMHMTMGILTARDMSEI